MGKLHAKAVECDYKEYNRELKEQLIYGLDKEGMVSEVFREVSAVEDINDVTSKGVPIWTQRIKAHRAL